MGECIFMMNDVFASYIFSKCSAIKMYISRRWLGAYLEPARPVIFEVLDIFFDILWYRRVAISVAYRDQYREWSRVLSSRVDYVVALHRRSLFNHWFRFCYQICNNVRLVNKCKLQCYSRRWFAIADDTRSRFTRFSHEEHNKKEGRAHVHFFPRKRYTIARAWPTRYVLLTWLTRALLTTNLGSPNSQHMEFRATLYDDR